MRCWLSWLTVCWSQLPVCRPEQLAAAQWLDTLVLWRVPRPCTLSIQQRLVVNSYNRRPSDLKLPLQQVNLIQNHEKVVIIIGHAIFSNNEVPKINFIYCNTLWTNVHALDCLLLHCALILSWVHNKILWKYIFVILPTGFRLHLIRIYLLIINSGIKIQFLRMKC